MDTNEQEPVGGQDVSSSQDTSADIAQPTQTEEVVDGNQSDEKAEASPLLAGKYKTQDELVKAHQELERKLGEQGQKAELANLLEKQTGMNYQQIKEYLAQQEYQQRQQLYADNPLLPVMDEVNQLKQIVQRQEQEKALAAEERKLDAFLKDNPDYEAHREKIFKLALTPGIGFDPNTQTEVPLEDIAREYFGQARAQGQQDAYKKIEKKVMTQATGASKGTPRTKITPEELDAMSHKDRIAAMEAMYPHADTSNRPY